MSPCPAIQGRAGTSCSTNVTTHAVEKSGHWVPEEQPEALIGGLDGFLK